MVQDKFHHDEEFSETLVAADHVDQWLDIIRSSLVSVAAKKQAISDLARHVGASPVYSQEAKLQGATHVLTRALTTFIADEDTLSLLTSAMSALSGSMALAETTSVYRLLGRACPSEGIQVRMREASLSQGGVGMRIWAAAAVLCREICTRERNLLANQHVLELGSGPGLCGIVAARMGAKSVTLTDFEDPVLNNLRACVDLNGDPRATSPCFSSASVCDAERRADSDSDAWTAGNMSVRYLNWDDDRRRINEADDYGGIGTLTPEVSVREAFRAESLEASGPHGRTEGTPALAARAPALPKDVSFPLILASDVMYEVDCCRMLAYTIRRRLAKGGACVMVNGIRQRIFLDVFRASAQRVGLRAVITDVDPLDSKASDGDASFGLCLNDVKQRVGGIIGKASDYEDGYKLFLIDREDAPFDWSRY